MTAPNVSPGEALHLAVSAFVDEMAHAGVRHVCACPGSRSTPLALAVARHPGLRLWMHLDERSCAYFGLGLAKALREPVALLCTSGTAAANFLPAVVEACHARVPLVALTADRPHELRDCGAPQSVDQVGLYGPHAKWFADLPEPQATPEAVRYLRTMAARAVATARRSPPGPVHLNCPFREPLVPIPVAAPLELRGRPNARPYVAAAAGRRALPPEDVADLARQLDVMTNGVIVCGPQDAPGLAEPLAFVADLLGYPVLADPLSGLRRGDHDRDLVLDAYDAFLRDDALAARLAPDVVLRFGPMPTSRPLLLYVQRHADRRQVVVDDDGWKDPTQLASDVLQADGPWLCEALADELRIPAGHDPDWLGAWRAADRLAREAIRAKLDGMEELFEGKVFAELATLLPAGSLLFAGNSMPVRDLDTFFPKDGPPLRLVGNRGASGIDGVISTALGAAASGTRPVVLVLGDLSFYHDANGLLAARRFGLDATIVLMNNDGGGIFSFLPQVAYPDHFEALFGTPHGLDFRPLAEAYGADYTRVASWDEFRRAVSRGIEGGGLTVVEVPTDRARNVALHADVWASVTRAVAGGAVPEVAGR